MYGTKFEFQNSKNNDYGDGERHHPVRSENILVSTLIHKINRPFNPSQWYMVADIAPEV